MFFSDIQHKKKAGFSLIEALLFLCIFTVVAGSFYRTITAGLIAMANSKVRIGAIKLANERMEIVHNLDYKSIWLNTSSPAGSIPNEEWVTRSGKSYYVNTTVGYVDDDFDDISTAEGGADGRPDDYKSVVVRVFWEKDNLQKSVAIRSFFIPPGIEEVHTGGILKVRVVDYSNQPIAGAKVHITNADTGIDVVDYTNTAGYIFLTGYAESIQKYKVVVEKSGYYAVHTYDPNPISSFLPAEVHGTVLNGNYNSTSLVTDRLATLNIFAKDMLGNALPNLNFILEGGKELGVEIVGSKPVYSYKKNSTTDAEGKVEVTDPNGISPGLYSFSFDNLTSGYEFIRMDYATTKNTDFFLSAGADLNATALFADKNLDALLGTVVNKLDGTPIAGASVTLESAALGYLEHTLVSDQFGKVYFPNDTTPLAAAQYDVTVTADGYQDLSDTVTINKLTKKNLELEAL